MSSLFRKIISFYGVRISIGPLIVRALLQTSSQVLEVEELLSPEMMLTLN